MDSKKNSLLRVLALIILLWIFLISVNGLGATFKYFKETVESILSMSDGHPIIGLLIGIIATSIVQSSSTTTSLIVTLVASGTITLPQAIPMIMGANIGTTITNTLVSMGSITRREEFRRSFAAANIHDMFNLMAVIIFLPLELMTGLISKSAIAITGMFFEETSIDKPNSFIKNHFKSVIKEIKNFFTDIFDEKGGHFALLIVSILFMILSLTFIVKTMKGPILAKAELFFDKIVGSHSLVAILFGAILTALVQSSSITTSLMVPLAGAGVITLRNLFPVTLGCNIGTTITALLAALASTGEHSHLAITIAVCHVLFNIYGIVFLYYVPPIRELIIKMAEKLAELCQKNRWFAPLYVVVIFFLIPGLAVLIQKFV